MGSLGFSSRRLIEIAALAALFVAALFVAALPVRAQDAGRWSELRDHENPATARQTVPRMRRGGITEPAVFDDHYYFRFEQFTHADQQNNLADLRASLKNELRASPDAGAHTRINEIAQEMTTRIALGDEFSPAARVNAALMLGFLNEREAVIGGGDEVPLPAAVDGMLQVWTGLEGSYSGVSDAIRLALLEGIERHLKSGSVADAGETRAATLMLTMTTAAEPPEGRDEETHAYFRTRAADILGVIGKTGTQRNTTDVLDSLMAMVGERDAEMYMRAAAANAIGMLDLSTPDGIDHAKHIGVLADFALAATGEGIKPRAVMYYLSCVDAALNGSEGNANALLASADGDNKAVAEEFKMKLEMLVEPLNDRRSTEEEIRAQLDTKVDEFKTWVNDKFAELGLPQDRDVPMLAETDSP